VSNRFFKQQEEGRERGGTGQWHCLKYLESVLSVEHSNLANRMTNWLSLPEQTMHPSSPYIHHIVHMLKDSPVTPLFSFLFFMRYIVNENQNGKDLEEGGVGGQ